MEHRCSLQLHPEVPLLPSRALTTAARARFNFRLRLRSTVAIGICAYAAIDKLDIEPHTGADRCGRPQWMPLTVADESKSTLEHFAV